MKIHATEYIARQIGAYALTGEQIENVQWADTDACELGIYREDGSGGFVVEGEEVVVDVVRRSFRLANIYTGATVALAVLSEDARSLEGFSNQADFVGWLRTLRS